MAGRWMDGEAERGAVTQREDLRQVAVEADERVIARNAGLQLA